MVCKEGINLEYMYIAKIEERASSIPMLFKWFLNISINKPTLAKNPSSRGNGKKFAMKNIHINL